MAAEKLNRTKRNNNNEKIIYILREFFAIEFLTFGILFMLTYHDTYTGRGRRTFIQNKSQNYDNRQKKVHRSHRVRANF